VNVSEACEHKLNPKEGLYLGIRSEAGKMTHHTFILPIVPLKNLAHIIKRQGSQLEEDFP